MSSLKINSKGHFKGLIILVEFPNIPFTIPQVNQRFNDLLNKEKYDYQGAYGSVRDYFIENSDSLFFPEFTVISPVNLKKNMSYYGENGENGEEIPIIRPLDVTPVRLNILEKN